MMGETAISPYSDLYRASVAAAYKAGASDIHYEPTRQGMDIRFRVLGDMQPPWKRLSTEHKHSFINEVKKETKLSIAVSGRPQDGRTSFRPCNIDLRVNLLPTLYGEKIVLRLLDLNRKFDLKALGILEKTLTDLKSAVSFKNGVVLISGPTGSGKTTTLYSLLCEIDRTKKNIITLEDPVEYTIDGINQVRVDAKMSFAAALRAVLRQDPDVILVGEIRDEETAALTFQAAATGHLVLSTIHANGAAEVIDRLLNLKTGEATILENLRFSAAQRLVKKVCPTCLGKGCGLCQSGIIARIPIIESLNQDQIKKYVSSGKNKDEIPGFCTLREIAQDYAKTGEISLEEAWEIE